jgi:hypothetical protein
LAFWAAAGVISAKAKVTISAMLCMVSVTCRDRNGATRSISLSAAAALHRNKLLFATSICAKFGGGRHDGLRDVIRRKNVKNSLAGGDQIIRNDPPVTLPP